MSQIWPPTAGPCLGLEDLDLVSIRFLLGAVIGGSVGIRGISLLEQGEVLFAGVQPASGGPPQQQQVCGDQEGVCHFPEESMGIEGDSHRTGSEASSNHKGNHFWIDPDAAKVFDACCG